MRILGLDVGDKRIGVAISDPTGMLASPLLIIYRDEDIGAIDKILVIIKDNKVDQILVGMPFSLSGELSSQARATMDFVEKLKARSGIEIILRDERLSTSGARRLMKEANGKKKKHRELLDAAAAAFILQGYLDSLELPKNQ